MKVENARMAHRHGESWDANGSPVAYDPGVDEEDSDYSHILSPRLSMRSFNWGLIAYLCGLSVITIIVAKCAT